MMDLSNESALTQNKTRLAHTFAKILRIRAATGAAKFERSQKTKLTEQVKHDKPTTDIDQSKFFSDEDEQFQKAVMDAFIAKVFATISSVKAAYSRLQYAESPYDAEGIQSADQIIISELKILSEFKQSFLKKHLDDDSPETTFLLAEIQEQKNLLEMYEITRIKLDNQRKLQDSEIIFLKEKLEEANRENKLIEKRVNPSGRFPEKLQFSSLSPNDLLLALRQTKKSIRSLVKLMISEMEVADWDLDAAANTIQPDVVYLDSNHKCYAFESFVCRVMFDGFNDLRFSGSGSFPGNDKLQIRRFLFDEFMELKSLKAGEHITSKPNSLFAKFCWSKYMRLVHPVMEFSLFGNLNQRNLVAAGKFPETTFFAAFSDVAKRVWLLHCLAFAFNPDEVSIFQIRKGSRFTDVFMESVTDEPEKSSPEVAFTVVPGFKVGKTVIQCQVYLS